MAISSKGETTVKNAAAPQTAMTGKLKMSDAQLQYIDKLLTILIAFTTFGASITFGLIVSDGKQPTDPANRSLVDNLIAVSWVLFVVGMLLASLATTVLYAYQHVTSRKHTDTRYVALKNFINYCEWKGSYAVILLYLIVLLLPLGSALLCLAVVVTMYVWTVGIAAVVFFGGGFAGILLFSLWYLALDAEQWARELEESRAIEGAEKLGADISKAIEGYVKSAVEVRLGIKVEPEIV